MLAARFSVPAMLSRQDEQRLISIVAALDGGLALLVISVAAWLSGLPLLFASLAPTAFILFTRPFSPAAEPRSIVLGHSMAIACGFSSWSIVSLFVDQPLSLADPSFALCLSADLAFFMTCVLLVRTSCAHPPACSTTLIVACGAMTGWPDLLVMEIAVLLLTYQGVLMHRLLGVHAPLWRIDPHDAAEINPGDLVAKGPNRELGVERLELRPRQTPDDAPATENEVVMP